MKIGYARVSKVEQNLDRQLDLLNQYGVDKIITKKFTGTKKDREGLNQLLDTIRENDTVIVESISRLGRKTLDILNVIQQFDSMGVKFVSLKENMDTNNPTGRAMLQMMCVIAELERNLIAERIKEGIEASKKRGTKLGRNPIEKDVIKTALTLYDSGDYSIKDVCKATGVSKSTLYRELDKRKAKD